MTRIIGLDYGSKRIGVAVTDPLGMTAQPRNMIESHGLQDNVEAVVRLVAQLNASAVVVGLPLRTDGSTGPEAEKILEFVERLQSALTIPVHTWDERFTSAQIQREFIAADVRRERRKQVVDSAAASLILQGFLAAQNFEADL